jgi:SOS-response transcriptional repressor LexA
VAVLGHEAHSLARQARGYPPGAERRADILAYIIDYKTVHDGLSPTIRDIASECNIPSTSTVSCYLDILESEGKIEFAEGRRGIMVVGGVWTLQAGDHAAQGRNGR